MLASATVVRPGRHATASLALRVVSSSVTRPRAGPSNFHYPYASAYNNILLRRQYTTPTPTSSPSTSSSATNPSTDAPPPLSQSEAQKKSKLDIRPAPIKPKPPSSTSAKASGKTNPADALKAPAPPIRKSASNMKQLKAKSPYFAEKDTAATSSPKPEKTAKAPPPPPPPPSSQQQTGADASKDAPLSGLGAAKAEAMQAVKDAEAHGILKPPPEGANWFRRTLHQAIELAKFYFRGVKLVYQRSKTVREIHARIGSGGARVTREEFRLISTQEDDVRKIVPFLLIALILEEVIPLIAIYAPGMLPSTCVLPSQRRSIEAKRAEKAEAFRKQYSVVFGELKRVAEMRSVPGYDGSQPGKRPLMYLVVDTKWLEVVKDAPIAVCGLLGLSTVGPDLLRMRRINHRLQFLLVDDQLLLREKTKAQAMSDRDLAEALQERGIPSPATSSRTQLNTTMDGWLTQALLTSDNDESSRRLALILTHA